MLLHACSGIQGAADAEDVLRRHMGVDHRCLQMPVSEEFLDRADVVAVFQQMGCETVAQGVKGSRFRQTCGRDGCFESPLQTGGMKMVTPCDVCPWIYG